MAKRTGIMLCYPFDQDRLTDWFASGRGVITQPKYDGHRCRIIYRDGQVLMLSSSEGKIKGFDSIIAKVKQIPEKNFLSCTDFELDGELYSPKLNFETLTSRIKTGDGTGVNFYAFDLIAPLPQEDRLSLLHFLLPQGDDLIQKAPSILARNDQDVQIMLATYMRQGYEGIILRHPSGIYEAKRSRHVMKLKPTKSDIYQIVSVVEEQSQLGVNKDTLGAFVLNLPDETDTFNVGTGPILTAAGRKHLWSMRETLPGMWLKVKYQQLTAGKMPRFPVALEVMTTTEGDVIYGAERQETL